MHVLAMAPGNVFGRLSHVRARRDNWDKPAKGDNPDRKILGPLR